jgi:uncharacterized membrane protein
VSRKWLEKEGEQWLKEGLIQKDQFEQILNRYPVKSSKSLLPIFASILIGLGILTFIGANWDMIPRLLKLLIIIISMTTFYLIGSNRTEKGDTPLGHALIGLGIVTFGAGLILVSQMFHFTFDNASNFILWSFGSLCMLALYRSKFIFLLSVIIIIVGQIYSVSEYHSFSYILALFLVFGIGHFVYHRANELFSTVFAISLLITGLVFVINENISYMWLTVFTLVLMLLAEVPNRTLAFLPMKVSGFIFQLFLVCFNIFMMDNLIHYEPEQIPTSLLYYSVLFLLSILYLYIVYKIKDWNKVLYLILFLPAFLLGVNADVTSILLLFLFAILALIVGYQYQLREYVNTGTFVFLVGTFVGYIQLAWDFMPKSLFFLSGGILLFALSWLLERRRRKWLKTNGGEPH